ncbi:MAG: DUF427 domain-containing protein [Acidobacteriia bacterium]|nr:DUF427 domain-containing protein [Terriglobia bacterium]
MTPREKREFPEQTQARESVWDYPRPPKVEPTTKRIRVQFAGEVVADTQRAMRVLETSHPPVYYIPRADLRADLLLADSPRTFCEFKGLASYWTLRVRDKLSANAAWSYERPSPGYEAISGHLAFYVARVDACFVNDERVQAQPGEFYGGWMTSEVIGPFKGKPGSARW